MNSSLTPEQRSEILLTNIDTSDCGVIALQAITGRKRKPMEALAKKNGYSPTTGAPRGCLEKALESIGYRTRKLDPRGETPATFSMTHENGLYLIYTEGHVMALVEGDLHNSRGNWRLACESITEVTR